MSLTLCVTTPEGIVLAADSRQSYLSLSNLWRVGSDSATKIIPLTKWIGVTVAGPAFLKKPEESTARSIDSFIRDFAETLDENSTVENTAEKLRIYLEQYYNPKEQLEKIKNLLHVGIEQQGGTISEEKIGKFGENVLIEFTDSKGKPNRGFGEVSPLTLIVAGYNGENNNNKTLSVKLEYIPGPSTVKRKHDDNNQFGALWTGQTDVVQRIILGKDSRLEHLPLMQGAMTSIGIDEVMKQLGSLEYNINWGTMGLRDGIDFATLMINTTAAIQKFSDGIKMQPGGIPGVGGEVDIAVIIPGKGFFWNKRKALDLVNI